jgi:hypothetical protein
MQEPEGTQEAASPFIFYNRSTLAKTMEPSSMRRTSKERRTNTWTAVGAVEDMDSALRCSGGSRQRPRRRRVPSDADVVKLPPFQVPKTDVVLSHAGA